MLSEKSIRRKFIIQLVLASAALIAIFSIILYNYIKSEVIEESMHSLKKDALSYVDKSKNRDPFSKAATVQYGQDEVSVVVRTDTQNEQTYEEYEVDGKRFLSIYQVFNPLRSTYVKITRDVSSMHSILDTIFNAIIIANLLMLFFILAYALFLSETLLQPVKSITRRLTRMNENFLEHIEVKELPDEFVPLGDSINRLIDRIHNFVKYQKELFIGTAHELKTPLAVMKAKNEVALMKDRNPAKYQETLKLNNTTIVEMNSMISSILEVGRQEGAQFDKPVEVDMIQFLKDKSKDFNMVAKGAGKTVSIDLEPDMYCIISQPSLITHILQNFVQNALKFTLDGGEVKIKSRLNGDDFTIEVIDDGAGIDESVDFFAPFKRGGDDAKAGAGLGLFLAKGAADAIGAKLSLKNTIDKKGTVATILLNSQNYCPVDDDGKNGGIFQAFKS